MLSEEWVGCADHIERCVVYGGVMRFPKGEPVDSHNGPSSHSTTGL